MEKFQQELLSPALFQAVVEKSNSVDSKYRLDMKPFIELYGKDQVMNDYEEIAREMKSYAPAERQAERLGFVLESAVLDLANNHQWLGENSEIVRASKYDDLIHKIDMIATLAPSNCIPSTFELGADLTFSLAKAGKKFERNLRQAKQGHLSSIKYFHSELTGFTGQKFNIPRTVIGLDRNNLGTLLRSWVHDTDGDFEVYRSHMIHQMQQQMFALRRFTRREHGESSKSYRAYNNAAEMLKGDAFAAEPLEDLPRDEITTLILEQVKYIK